MSAQTKRARVAAAEQTLMRLRANGCIVTLINEQAHQYRVQAPEKGSVEFYMSTGRWHGTHDSSARGSGIEDMLAAIYRLERPQTATQKLSLPMLTVFADASFDHRKMTAGWGGWVKGDGTPTGLLAGGPIQHRCANSQEAEMWAIAYALQFAREKDLVPADGVVLIESDCQAALSMMLWRIPSARDNPARGGVIVSPSRRPTRTLKESEALEAVGRFFDEPFLRLQVRHVRGHQKGAVGRGWVNQQCDRLARAGRKQMERA